MTSTWNGEEQIVLMNSHWMLDIMSGRNKKSKKLKQQLKGSLLHLLLESNGIAPEEQNANEPRFAD
jgi:hypothetical protein